jgi:SAM-dependent methyltransferase
MHWRLKGVIQSALGSLPFGGEKLHYFLQRHAGGLKNFDRECDIKVEDFRLMVKHLRSVGVGTDNTRFVEIGSGWYPTFPFCLYLSGAHRVHTLDLNRHMKADLTLACATRLGQHVATIAEACGGDASRITAKQQALVRALAQNATVEQATEGVVHYLAPADASKCDLLDDSVDVVFSNSVLEHIPGPVIEGCFTEARRILRAGGVVFHSVNCGDHYAYVDSSIHQLNYLQYSDAQWQRWNNRFLYQNRLRAVDFTNMARAAGFLIELDTSRPHPKRLQELTGIAVDASFSSYTPEQLAITSIDLIGRNPD